MTSIRELGKHAFVPVVVDALKAFGTAVGWLALALLLFATLEAQVARALTP